MAEAVLTLVGPMNGFVHVLAAYERQEWHHLLGGHERVVVVGLAKHQLEPGASRGPRRLREERGVLAEQILTGHPVAMGALARHHDGPLGQCVHLVAVEPQGAGLLHRRHHPVEHAGHHEHLLLADAEEIVVVGRARDDRPGGVVEVGRIVDDDRRIAGAGHDRPLGRLQSRPGHGGAAGHADQLHAAVIEEGAG